MTAPNETRLLAYILAQLSLEPRCAVIDPGGRLHGDEHYTAVFWRQNTGAARTRDRLIRFGIPGQSDITGVIGGRRIDIEVKAPDGKQSAEQKRYEFILTAAHSIYLLARSLDDVLIPVRELLC